MYEEDLEVPHSIYDLERVLDWEKRIANYSPSVQQKYRALIKKKDDLFRYLDEAKSNGWSVMINNKKKDLYAETKNSVRGIPMIRARTYSNYDPLTTFRIVGSSDMRPKYDKNIHSQGRILFSSSIKSLTKTSCMYYPRNNSYKE